MIQNIAQWGKKIVADRLQSIFFLLEQKKELLFLLTTGTLILGAIDVSSVQRLQRDQDYRQMLMAQQLQAQIQSALNEHVTILTSLDVVYQNFVDISHYDFQQYGQSITSNLRGFRRLFFISPARIIQRVYPLSPENTKLLGIPVSSDPKDTAIFTQAKEARKPTASGLITFMGHSRSVLAVMPIYRHDKEFLGFAAAEISLQDVWEPFNHSEFLSHYEVQIVDPLGLGFFKGARLGQPDRILTRLPFHVANRQWTLLLQTTQPTFEILAMQRITLWIVGLLILYLIHQLVAGSKRYRINLGEAQRQFETIFHASPDGILMLGDKLQLQLANPPIEAWSGLAREELAGNTFFELFTCQCPHVNKCRELSFLLCTSHQFEQELPETLETRITHVTSDKTRILRLNASRIKHKENQKGQSDGFICVLGDISTGKELEGAKETFVATLTHDLKTPLLAQEMILDKLLSGKAGEVSFEQHRLLSGASASVKDLLEMVNATLLYYKLESTHLPLQRQSVSLLPLIKEVIETLRPLAEKRELLLEIESAVHLPQVSLDPVQMKRVFHNLLSNAIGYARRGSRIRINIEPESTDKVRIGIYNQGKGIPPDELPKVFEKYHSLSRRFKQIGTGLGLYISRRIVELHGGQIWAESEPGNETRFFVSLPCLQSV